MNRSTSRDHEAEQDNDTGQLNHPEEVLCLHLVACPDAPKTLQPRDGAFDLLAPLEAAQRTTILSFATISLIGRDHLNAQRSQLRIEPITVIRFISDQPFWEHHSKRRLQGVVNQCDFC